MSARDGYQQHVGERETPIGARAGNSQLGLAVMPDGNGGFVFCPDVLTAEEAVRFLRLDIDGPKHPTNTLKYFRERGLLKGTKVGRRVRYRIADLRVFLAELAELQNV